MSTKSFRGSQWLIFHRAIGALSVYMITTFVLGCQLIRNLIKKKDILKCFSGGSLPPEGLPFISRPCGTAYGKSRRHCNTGSRGQDQDRDRLRDPIHLQLGAGAVLDHWRRRATSGSSEHDRFRRPSVAHLARLPEQQQREHGSDFWKLPDLFVHRQWGPS